MSLVLLELCDLLLKLVILRLLRLECSLHLVVHSLHIRGHTLSYIVGLLRQDVLKRVLLALQNLNLLLVKIDVLCDGINQVLGLVSLPPDAGSLPSNCQ